MQKKTFKIGEVAEILGLKGYVLRYWETEFSQLVPLRTEKGQRLYTDKHIDLLKKIRDLLHVKGMTIEGTRKILASGDNLKDTVKEANVDINIIIDPSNNVIGAEALLGQNKPNIAKSACDNVNKDELMGIFKELTLIQELLERS